MSYRFQLILLVSAANIIYSHQPDSLSNTCLMPQSLKNDPEPRLHVVQMAIHSSDVTLI